MYKSIYSYTVTKVLTHISCICIDVVILSFNLILFAATVSYMHAMVNPLHSIYTHSYIHMYISILVDMLAH